MAIKVGDRLPEATFMKLTKEGGAAVTVSEMTKGRRIVLFALPGAYTGTCSTAHVPSFIRTKPQFDAKGIDEVVCVSVNDPFVMMAWGEATGATNAGITFLSDPAGDFTRAVEMEFSSPGTGLIGRSRRYAMIVEDGVVKTLNVEEKRGVCELTAGEVLLAAI